MKFIKPALVALLALVGGKLYIDHMLTGEKVEIVRMDVDWERGDGEEGGTEKKPEI